MSVGEHDRQKPLEYFKREIKEIYSMILSFYLELCKKNIFMLANLLCIY